MGRLKKIGTALKFILIAAGIGLIYYYFQTWPLRFHSELDAFFGKGNWEQVSSETKESMMYTTYVSSRGTPHLSGEQPGKFHEWEIAFTNRDGETEVWMISDHTMRINQDKHWFLNPERYSAKQALTLELMDVSTSAVGEQLRREVLQKILPEQEAMCLDVYISYRDGNPPPRMYDQLRKEPWFTANSMTAADYLETDLYDFFIGILADDYRVKKLTVQEQQHLVNSLGEIERALREEYGEYADYDIYLGEGYAAEFSGERARLK